MEGLLCIYCFGIIFFVFKAFNKFNLLKENKIVYKIWGLLSVVYLSDVKRRSTLPDNLLIQPMGGVKVKDACLRSYDTKTHPLSCL